MSLSGARLSSLGDKLEEQAAEEKIRLEAVAEQVRLEKEKADAKVEKKIKKASKK